VRLAETGSQPGRRTPARTPHRMGNRRPTHAWPPRRGRKMIRGSDGTPSGAAREGRQVGLGKALHIDVGHRWVEARSYSGFGLTSLRHRHRRKPRAAASRSLWPAARAVVDGLCRKTDGDQLRIRRRPARRRVLTVVRQRVCTVPSARCARDHEAEMGAGTSGPGQLQPEVVQLR